MSKYFSIAQEEAAQAAGYNSQDLADAWVNEICPHCDGVLVLSEKEEPICSECDFLKLSDEDE